MRVVSLLPGATEMVAALGRLEQLVGVTHECDHPDVVSSRVRVTATAVDVAAAPDVVDSQVRGLTDGGAAVFTLLEDRIRDLRPDLILTQALCDVCAVVETDVRALAARLDPVPQVVTLNATSLDGVLDDITHVGAALDAADEAEEFVAGARARMRTVHETLKAARAPRPRVAVVEWGDPLYLAGHWMPEMIARAGGVDPLVAKGAHSTVFPLGQIRDADPEVIVIAPCGYGLDRAAAEGERLLALEEWSWARGRRVWAIDANAFASRPGPRLVDGVEILARLCNPSLFSPVDSTFARPLNEAARTAR
jgi:iron complex transport system substrate-binding protein